MTRRSRRRSGAQLTIISWRDIPAQVTASSGDNTGKALLSARFQHAIDRAAVVADMTDTQSYVGEWQRTTKPLAGDLAGAAEAEAELLEEAYPRDRLEALVANGGAEATASTSSVQTFDAPPDANPDTSTGPETLTEPESGLETNDI